MTTNRGLSCPQSYLEATFDEKAAICNGCGAKGDWKSKYISNSVWWVDIKEACDIHDWRYYKGNTIEDKNEADREFLNNMFRIIWLESGWHHMRILREKRALKYYNAVVMFGGPAFWQGKNESI